METKNVLILVLAEINFSNEIETPFGASSRCLNAPFRFLTHAGTPDVPGWIPPHWFKGAKTESAGSNFFFSA